MIIQKLKGRIGNQLFQIAYAYIVSKRYKQNILVIPVSKDGFQLDAFKTPIFLNFLNPKLILIIHRIIFKLLSNVTELRNDSCFIKHNIPSINFTNLLIEGYFQDAEIYLPYKYEFQNLFRLKKKYRIYFENKYSHLFSRKVLVLNLRLKEYPNFHFIEINSTPFISNSWYENVLLGIDRELYDDIIVISDDIEASKDFLGGLPFDFRFIDDFWYVDFQFLLYGDILIIPNSSFSWWGAFLNNKQRKIVYAPKYWVGNNVNREYPKGIMFSDFNWV